MLKNMYFSSFLQAFACLKVETCSRIPVCFVEDTPDLGHESLRYCSLWNLLLQGLQVKSELTMKKCDVFFSAWVMPLANRAVYKNSLRNWAVKSKSTRMCGIYKTFF